MRPLIFVIAGAFALATARCAAAVKPDYVQLTASEAAAFQVALTALASQSHVAVVAEGVPLHPLLSTQDALRLTTPLPLGDEIGAVAAAYDYDARREGNVFVLTKRYSDPDDLPVITQAECEHSLQQMQEVSAPFDPPVRPDYVQPLIATPGPQMRRDQYRIVSPLVDPLASSLTPAQLAAMSTNALSVSSMSSAQRTAAKAVCLSLYLQEPMGVVALAAGQLPWTEQQAVFCRQDINGSNNVFGYTLPRQDKEVNLFPFHPLSRFNGEISIRGISFFAASPGPDPTSPPSSPQPQETAETLSDVLSCLPAAHATADAAVADKPVTVAGLGNAAPGAIVQALVDVYGLRLVNALVGAGRVHVISLSVTQPPSDVANLPGTLRQTIPAPLARAMHMDKIIAEQQQLRTFLMTPLGQDKRLSPPASSDTEETPTQLEQAMREREAILSGPSLYQSDKAKIVEAEAYLSVLHTAAIRRLRALVEPEMPPGQAGGIAITALGEADHDALATIILIEALQSSINPITEPVPEVVSNFDQVILGGGVSGDDAHPMFSVVFYSPGPYGKPVMEGGLGGIDYIRP